MLDRWIAAWWLGQGQKYRLSAYLAGPDWHLPFSAVVAKHHIRLDGATSLRDVVSAFTGRVFWQPDLCWQIRDTVSPPVRLIAEGGDDCDGMAMLHAQAVDHALGPLGWGAAIVSYLARDVRLSHHVCAAKDPDGRLWVIQPQPMRGHDADPLPGFVFRDHAHLARVVASWYHTDVIAYDVRTPQWEPTQSWRDM